MTTLNESNCDALVLVSFLDKSTFTGIYEKYAKPIEEQKKFDVKFNKDGGLMLLHESPFKRLIYSPIGPVNRDFDDIRTFCDAAVRGISRALKAGSRNPLIVLPRASDIPEKYATHFDLAIILAVYQILYIPLENREYKSVKKVDSLGFTNFASAEREAKVLKLANAIECGRAVARDIGGSDPERMSAPKVVEYVEELFKGTSIKVQVISDLKVIEKEFPCLGKCLVFLIISLLLILFFYTAAVNRASVDRHAARVIFLTYEPSEAPKKNLFLVGKGVTYDTGGADIKSGGIMAGMHRDKCGAAAVAGFFETLDKHRPKNVCVFGAMAMVRNSIGNMV